MNSAFNALPGSIESSALAVLDARGLMSSAELQAALGKSQPTVSRALRNLGAQVSAFGQGRSTRYGRLAPILGLPAQQPLWWTDESGQTAHWGTLSLLSGQRVVVESRAGTPWQSENALPWFLSPLRLQGFLGRAWAQAPGLVHLGTDIERWSVEQQLFAVLSIVDDEPGAFSIGERIGESVFERFALAPSLTDDRLAHYDAIASNVAGSLPAHSSAGGEQPKFLATVAAPGSATDFAHLLVKFSPPHRTPFGQRWHDLLHAEALALDVMAQAGEPVARCRVIESGQRTYLESLRFDRLGGGGRRHVVALDAAHRAFVGGALQHWAATADALAAQGRLSADDARRARLWRAYGRLIGNTDMHFGNLGLHVDDVTRGRFALARCYDMLPMTYRPDAHRDDFGPTPITPATPTLADTGIWPTAARWAIDFWRRVAAHRPCSAAFRQVAEENASRIATADRARG